MADQVSVGVVVVTHDSARFLGRCLAALAAQSAPPRQIVVVDSGSADTGYLDVALTQPRVRVLREANLGFCEGNNRGAALLVDRCDYVLFLNPDCFVGPDCLRKLTTLMGEPEYRTAGAAGITLRGFDITAGAPTGLMDCTGIFQKWYGRWYSRDQGRPVNACRHDRPEAVPAVTGAFLFCRSRALREVRLGPDEFFDRRFFMYKEDIDLALRLRAGGWDLVFFPELQADHCRAWKRSADRSRLPRALRLMAARNECRLPTNSFLRNPASVKWLFSAGKLLYVFLLER